MSYLKKLKKNQKKSSGTILSSGIVLLVENQIQFNQLASLYDGLDEDSIEIDEVYIAYMDEYPALQVEPMSNFAEDEDYFLEACKHKNLKPLDFDQWYKKNKKG